jgi:hypothetical protein
MTLAGAVRLTEMSVSVTTTLSLTGREHIQTGLLFIGESQIVPA